MNFSLVDLFNVWDSVAIVLVTIWATLMITDWHTNRRKGREPHRRDF